jgi:hypothetical protein
MSDNIPSNIIKNIPPFQRPFGNNGDSFILQDGITMSFFNRTYIAQEDDQSTITPTLSSPINTEDGTTSILIETR